MKPTTVLFGLALALGAVAGLTLFSGQSEGALERRSAEAHSGLDAVNDNPRHQTIELDRPGAGRSTSNPAGASTEFGRVALSSGTGEEPSASAQSSPKGPFLRGVVTDMNGMVVAGAELKFTAEGRVAGLMGLIGKPFVERIESGSGGEYKVSRRGLLGGTVDVTAKMRGFLVLSTERGLGDIPGDAWLEDLQLERGVVLAGLVVDENDVPVAGARVVHMAAEEEMNSTRGWFVGSGETSVVSGEDGHFEFLHIEPGPYVLLAIHEEFPRGRIEGDAPFAGFEEDRLVVRFPASATIAGKISGMPNGSSDVMVDVVPSESALEGDRVVGGGFMLFQSQNPTRRFQPDSQGNFVATGLDPGRSYMVMATMESGFMSRVLCSDRVLASGGDLGVELAWDSGARVVFQLVDGETQKPVKSSVVRFRWEKGGEFQLGLITREFASSHVELSELRPSPSPGSLSMLIETAGYLNLKRDGIVVNEGELVDLGRLDLLRAPLVRVHVLDAVTGKGLRRGRVVLKPDVEESKGKTDLDVFEAIFGTLTVNSSKGKTQPDGWCELAATASSTATLTVQRKGYVDFKLENVAMPKKGQLKLEARMVTGGELDITIIDLAGLPVGGAELTYRGPNDYQGSTTASGKGRLKLKDLAAGEYEMYAERPRGTKAWLIEKQEPNWQRMTVAANVKQKVTFRVPLEVRLKGTVTVGGSPLAGVDVKFVVGPAAGGVEEAGSGGMSSEAMNLGEVVNYGVAETDETNSKGFFELGRLSSGSHRLSVQVAPGAPAHMVDIELVEGENSVSFDLKVGKLSGFVLDPDGQGIPGAHVVARPLKQTDQGAGTLVISGYTQGFIETDEHGHFEFAGLPLDTPFEVQGTAEGYIRHHTQGQGLLANSSDIRLTLQVAGSARINLVGPMIDIEFVRAQHEDGEFEMEWSSGDSVLFKGLKPGEWTFSVGTRPNKDSPGVKGMIVAGERVVLTLNR